MPNPSTVDKLIPLEIVQFIKMFQVPVVPSSISAGVVSHKTQVGSPSA